MKLTTLIILSGVTFSSCALPDGIRNPTEEEWITLARAYDAWEQNINYIDSSCAVEFNDFKIASFDTVEETDVYCDKLLVEAPGLELLTPGCFIEYSHGPLLQCKTPIIVYHKNNKNMKHILLHEFSHWAEYCQTGVTGTHENKDVWDNFVFTGPAY